MQSKSLVFLLIVFVSIPIFIISSNHEIFFFIFSVILTVISIRNFYLQLTGESFQGGEADDELEEELEELIGIDVKKFGKGLNIVYNLLVILFLCYCTFFLDTVILKAVASFAILLQIYFIIKKTRKMLPAYNADLHKPQILFSSVLNIAVIVLTLLNKVFRIN